GPVLLLEAALCPEDSSFWTRSLAPGMTRRDARDGREAVYMLRRGLATLHLTPRRPRRQRAIRLWSAESPCGLPGVNAHGAVSTTTTVTLTRVLGDLTRSWRNHVCRLRCQSLQAGVVDVTCLLEGKGLGSSGL
ncbi:unnamed protein product, partial [Effrenium voratum]